MTWKKVRNASWVDLAEEREREKDQSGGKWASCDISKILFYSRDKEGDTYIASIHMLNQRL